ncbi:putative protein phosphatase 2C 60 [Dorcoceras hygrometricum]|uniref:protein-serine/threonine phosphatase n=1 Tax=Dorcoceras hygrometricum TaxID=472368 RepID=A0A2Z7AM64_9LAMI|nr:putative protein phosphatase 2C 60 [Dorcoceras hygrometricum]
MGVYLSTPKTEKFSENGENQRLMYGVSSMQGWRSTMEDAHAAYTNLDSSTSFFGVYDGHGGKEVAKFCAKFLHQEMLEHEAYRAGDLETSIRQAFLRDDVISWEALVHQAADVASLDLVGQVTVKVMSDLNRMDEMMCEKAGRKELALLRGKADRPTDNIVASIECDDVTGQEGDSPYDEFDNKGPTSGSTACVAIIRNNQLIVANAGDSRCVLSRKGQACELSKDHKPDLHAEKKRILEAGGYVQYGRVNGSLNLSRAIGDMEMKQNKLFSPEEQTVTANPDIITVELSEDDDFLIIACDGIWDCMSSKEAVGFVQEQLKTEKKLSVVCERVLDRCLAPASGGEGCDNMTMILVQFKKTFQTNTSS